MSSNALLLLGHETIASFTETTAGATLAANLYESSYLSILTSHRWRFATKKATLARLAAAPLNDYTYAYQIPSECLYLIQTDTVNYEVFGAEVYTNASTLEVEYIYRVDESKLPAYFSKMLEFYLAAQFAVPITGDMDKGKYFSGMYLNELKKAKFTDSTQRPNVSMQAAPYVHTRY